MTNEAHRAPRVTAVMRFVWNARERGYTANHGQHTYRVWNERDVWPNPWVLDIDGAFYARAATKNTLLKLAQDRARAELDSEA